MKSVEGEIFSYQISLKKTLPKQSSPIRKGLILQLKSMDRTAWGEISPLPSWSQETLVEAKEEMTKILPRFLKIDWKPRFWKKQLHRFLLGLFPSVSFGIESAALDLFDPITEPIPPSPLSGYLSGTCTEIFTEAKALKRLHYQVVKVKVNQLTLKEAIDVSRYLKNQFQLRIDVNKSWPLEHALEFCRMFKKNAFEYLEDPVDNFEDLQYFSKKTGFPIAVDEYFRESSFKQLLRLPSMKAIIVKPMLQGSFSLYEKNFPLLAQKKIDIVLSSSYESGLGILQLIKRITRTPSLINHIGVGTYRLIKEDLLSTPHRIINGHLHVSENPYPLASRLSP